MNRNFLTNIIQSNSNELIQEQYGEFDIEEFKDVVPDCFTQVVRLPFEFQGKTYHTTKEAAEDTGIPQLAVLEYFYQQKLGK